MNQLENCQARYRSNTWMGRTRTDGPDEFEPTKFDCNCIFAAVRVFVFLSDVYNIGHWFDCLFFLVIRVGQCIL